MTNNVFIKTNGEYSQNPTSRKDAIQLRRPRYDDDVQCHVCMSCSVKFTSNNRCIHCARLDAIHFYNAVACGIPWPAARPLHDDLREAREAFPQCGDEFFPTTQAVAIKMGSPVWVRVDACAKAGHVGVRLLNGSCWQCEVTNPARDPARAVARSQGEPTYTPSKKCARCNTKAPRRTQDNRCLGCHPINHDPARAAARRRGDKIYTPSKKCPKCGTRSARDVMSNKCHGCNNHETAQLMNNNPDLVITRADARTLRFKVYRTGEPCKHGHITWRYVSTSVCVECMRK